MKHTKTVKRDLKISKLRYIDNKDSIKSFEANENNEPFKTERRNDDSLSFDKLKKQNNLNISVMKEFINHTEKKLSFLKKSKAQELKETSSIFQSILLSKFYNFIII